MVQRNSLKEAIFPAVAQVTGAASDKLRVIDAFVVRYDASKQKALPLHSDQSEYSITLPLNDRTSIVEAARSLLP